MLDAVLDDSNTDNEKQFLNEIKVFSLVSARNLIHNSYDKKYSGYYTE